MFDRLAALFRVDKRVHKFSSTMSKDAALGCMIRFANSFNIAQLSCTVIYTYFFSKYSSIQHSPRETLRVEGKQNSLFPVGPVIKCFVIPSNSKIQQIKLTYVSKKLKSVFFSSSKLRCKFCSLQNSFKVLTAFCVPCLWISNFYPVSVVQFLLLFGLESVSRL